MPGSVLPPTSRCGCTALQITTPEVMRPVRLFRWAQWIGGIHPDEVLDGTPAAPQSLHSSGLETQAKSLLDVVVKLHGSA